MENKTIFKNEEFVFMIILMINPLLDMIYTVNTVYLNISIPINQIIRIIIVAYFFLKLRERSSVKIIAIVLMFLLLSEISCLIITGELKFVIKDSSYIIKIIYFVIAIMYVKEKVYHKQMSTKNILKGLTLGALVIIINIFLAKYLNIGLKSYDDGVRDGVKGLFTVVNTITAMMIIAVPAALGYYEKTKKTIYVGIYLIGCFSLMLIGTKFALATAILLIASIIVYFFVFEVNKKNKKIFLGMIIFLLLVVLCLGKDYIYNFLEAQIKIFNEYKYTNFIDFITSNRTLQVYYLDEYISKLGWIINPIYLFGLGFNFSNLIINTGKSDFQMLEMDFHGLLYYSGIFIFAIIVGIIIVTFIKSFKLLILKREIKIDLILTISLTLGTFHAMFAGHVIYEAGPLLYYGAVIGLILGRANKNNIRVSKGKLKDKILSYKNVSKINFKINKSIDAIFYYEEKYLKRWILCRKRN